MKIIRTIGIVAGLVSMMAVSAFAQTQGAGFFVGVFDKDLSASGTGFYARYDLDSNATYSFTYEGSATVGLSGVIGTAALTGTTKGVPSSAPSVAVESTNIWRYYYQTKDSNWHLLDTLVGPISCTTTNKYESAANSGHAVRNDNPFTISGVTAIGIGYDVLLSKSSVGGWGTGTGGATMTATAVPEPGTIFAAMSILAPVGFVFRRKKA